MESADWCCRNQPAHYGLWRSHDLNACDEQALPFTEFLLALPEDQRPQTFAVVSQDDSFTLGVKDSIKASLTEAGMELVFDEIYAPETTDRSSIAIQVADLNPDLIVV